MKPENENKLWFGRGKPPDASTGLLLGCLFFVSACSNGSSQAGRSAPPPDSTHQSANEAPRAGLQRIIIAEAPLLVETAQTDADRQRGLMFRERLPADQGMLFVFPVSQIQSFWMRNTFIPLDIAFISSAGVIVDIQYMKPVDESILYTSRAPALYALEVNAGWFAKHDIQVGAQVKF
jgi:hypothetical protein